MKNNKNLKMKGRNNTGEGGEYLLKRKNIFFKQIKGESLKMIKSYLKDVEI